MSSSLRSSQALSLLNLYFTISGARPATTSSTSENSGTCWSYPFGAADGVTARGGFAPAPGKGSAFKSPDLPFGNSGIRVRSSMRRGAQTRRLQAELLEDDVPPSAHARDPVGADLSRVQNQRPRAVSQVMARAPIMRGMANGPQLRKPPGRRAVVIVAA